MKAALRVAAIGAGLVALLALTFLAFGLPVAESLTLVVEGAFSGDAAWSRTLVRTTPLLLTGLAMMVAWRAGMYNIGGEGQYVVGGLVGATVAKAGGGMPPALLSAAILAATVVGGAGYAALAAYLQVRRGVQVVVSTILLNFLALQILDWAVSGPLQESKGQIPQTDRLPEAAMLMRFDRQTDLNSGVFLALAVAVCVGVWIMATRSGFNLRLVGENPRAARAALVNVSRVQVWAMTLSGALCGLSGGVEYVGLLGQLDRGFAQQWGFLGIPVALLGGLHPAGVALAAGYFGALFAGLQNLSMFSQGAGPMVYVVQGVAVMGVVGLAALAKRRRAPAPEDA